MSPIKTAADPQIRIVSDGTRFGTKVTWEATGEEIKYVTKVEWSLDANEGIAKCALHLFEVEVDLQVPDEDSESA